MTFSLNSQLQVLERTPAVLQLLLHNLDEEWTDANEGENTWNVKEVVAHLIICEQTNWPVRMRIILGDEIEKTFVPIDMTAHFALANSQSLRGLLHEFGGLRKKSIEELVSLDIGKEDLAKTAIHPKLGAVNLQQLIATWVTHDLTHISQILRIMAKRNKENVGPFEVFLRILKS